MKSLSVIKVYFYFRPNEVKFLTSVARNVQSPRCDALVPAVASAAAFVATLRMKGRREAPTPWNFASKLTKTTLVMLKICAKLWILILFMICTGQDSHEGKQCCNTGRCCWHWQWTHLACPACLFCDFFALFRTLANIPSWSKKIEWSLSRTAESRARKTSLWKQRCVPSEQESNLRYAGAALILLVGIYKHLRCLSVL